MLVEFSGDQSIILDVNDAGKGCRRVGIGSSRLPVGRLWEVREPRLWGPEINI